MAIENETYNSQCRMMIGHLKSRSAPIKEWIQHSVNIEPLNHDDSWIGEMISKGFRKSKVKISNVLIVAYRVTRERIIGIAFEQTVFLLGMIQQKAPSFWTIAKMRENLTLDQWMKSNKIQVRQHFTT